MKWELGWNDPFAHYLEASEPLMGDRRTIIECTPKTKPKSCLWRACNPGTVRPSYSTEGRTFPALAE
jgi:hypothetical protein